MERAFVFFGTVDIMIKLGNSLIGKIKLGVCMGLFDTKVEAVSRAFEDRTIPLNVIAEKTKLTVEHVVKQDEKEDQKRGTAKENNILPIKTTKYPYQQKENPLTHPDH
ncbi:hypothetical protein L1887_23348 [Cichorium endivia]|nr:hypothetical protein L1887_23348 [Cichorium endivia]